MSMREPTCFFPTFKMAVILRRLPFVCSRLTTYSTESELNLTDWIELTKTNEQERTVKVKNGINDCPKSCLCSNNIEIDHKNVRLLSQFVSSQTGMIYPRTYTKICLKKQREVARAIRRARAHGFMPVVYKIHEYVNDPEIFKM